MPYKDKRKLYDSQMRRWKRRKQEAVEYMGGSCVRCGFRGPSECFDFHHIDPSSKEFTWTKLRLRSWDSIYKELAKCILICANCHRIEHAKHY